MLETNEPKRKKCSPIIKFFALIGMSTTFFSILSLVAVAYIWFADPFGIRPLLQGNDLGSSFQALELLQDGGLPSFENLSDIAVGADGKLDVPEEYTELLDVVGIDLDALANQDPEVLEACATAEVGEARALELANGAEPGISDFFALRKCL